VCKDHARSAEVKKNPSRFQKLTKLRKDNIFRMQARPKVTGFAEKSKAIAFETLKIF
jgi:hypothetical protein